MKKFFSSFYNLYLVFLGAIITLPILGPIFLFLGLELPAKIIYFIYSFFCHQFASRSINIFDYQIAWCARDTGIWFAFFFAALLVKLNKLPKLKIYWVIPFIIPMALDGGLQTIFTYLNLSPDGVLTGEPLYVSTNLTRFITGSVFGFGVSWWLSQQIKETSNTRKQNEEESKSEKSTHLFWIGIFSVGVILVYSLLFLLWDISSTRNDPLAPLDFVVKTETEDFFVRRGNGICPTGGSGDLLGLECFF